MKVVSIEFNELAKKPFQVLVSNRNMKATLEFQRDLLELSESYEESKEPVNQISNSLKMIETQQSYIIKMLKLDDKQVEQLDESVDTERTQEIASKIVDGILDIPENVETGDESPKA